MRSTNRSTRLSVFVIGSIRERAHRVHITSEGIGLTTERKFASRGGESVSKSGEFMSQGGEFVSESGRFSLKQARWIRERPWWVYDLTG
eukprot:5781562-Pyramimonas_sp.AAC.1